MALDIKKVNLEGEDYPKLLKEIPLPPPTLYYLGDLPTPRETMIAIVGTRKLTPDGRTIARQIAKDLAARGVIVVSGLALGIDSAAHEGALLGGKTIAVLANGLDKIYPSSHENLAREILAKGGAIVSEYPPGTPPYPSQFLDRNRIISGLTIATVVIEMPNRSGASVTAKNALDQGREVFVVPGPARHPNYVGSHLLIRQGARLATSAEEILDDLGLAAQKEKRETDYSTNPVAEKVFNSLKEATMPLTIDNISEITKLEPHIVSQELTYLLIDGLITEKNNKFQVKK